jgi:hypothetical protein
MKTNYIMALAVGLLTCLPACAQKETTKGILWSAAHGWEYSVKAGVSIGGTAPLPMPREIRSIKKYDPMLNLFIEANTTKWFNDNWGLRSGIRFERKGMDVNARVKDYNIELLMPGETNTLTGRWTGLVRTKVDQTYLTIPLMATYKLSSVWMLQGGLYASYMLNGEFKGDAYDGYIRDETPVGNKMELKDGQQASYDFSDDLRRFAWGAQVGAEWEALKHLTVTGNLTWGFNNIFKKDFKTITFSMYPIYLNVGFGYSF